MLTTHIVTRSNQVTFITLDVMVTISSCVMVSVGHGSASFAISLEYSNRMPETCVLHRALTDNLDYPCFSLNICTPDYFTLIINVNVKKCHYPLDNS